MIIRSVVFMYHQSCRNNTIFITTMVDVSSPLRTNYFPKQLQLTHVNNVAVLVRT